MEISNIHTQAMQTQTHGAYYMYTPCVLTRTHERTHTDTHIQYI